MTQRSQDVKAFHASEIQKQKPNQVFYSPGARRGWILLTVLVVLGCLVAIAVDWAQTVTTELPPTAARYNTSVNYPREVANAVLACAKTDGQYGDNGALQVPVIGNGVFQRVVKVVPDGGTDYAVDPFTGQVYRPLTQLEAHAAGRCGYAVEEYGTVPDHTLILTYDDGPSGQWTPQILGILEAYHVHATFFNIGSQDLLYEDVFRAVLAHGNAVGNHSYTHPYLVDLSNVAARNELVETSRVQAQLGDYQSRIWRTPYQGGDPVSAGNGMFDTLMGQQLGLTEVGFTNDTSDYALVGKEIPPPPLSRSASSPGMVVIMHDGGGNRASTVALTKKVVRQGVSYGYAFLTIPQLLAQQPGWHGPVISRNVAPTRVDTAGYWLKAYAPALQGWYADFIRYMTVVIITISVLVLVGAALDRWLSYRRPPTWQPAELGVLIPCWKESKVIRNTVERVLHAGEGCPFPLHIVLVDDGSADNDPTDQTWQILCELAAEYPEVRAVQQHNGGKARALNFGLQYVTSDLVVVMDADTIPKDAESFTHLVRWFGDSRVGAVAGYTKAGDRGKGWRQHVIAEFQAAEYDLGIALIRSVQNLSNSIVIVPGAFSAFRTEWLREVGFLPDRVVAEDAEAPQRMRRVRPRMRILQDLTAVAYTEVPLTFKVLRKQWRRWTIGVLQTLFEHREIFVRMDKYQLLTLQWWFALYGNVIPSLFLPLSYAMIIYGAVSGTLGPIYLFPAIFIAFRAVQTIAAMIILRTKMNPFVAIWYRLINDPLQIYLTAVCYWMILSGRMPTTRKIWTQVPRSGVVVGGAAGPRKVGVDAVQVPEAAGAPSAAEPAVPVAAIEPAGMAALADETALSPDSAPTEALPLLPMGAPVTEADPMPTEAELADASRMTQPIKIGEALRRIPDELRGTKLDWARQPNGKSEPAAAEPNGKSEPTAAEPDGKSEPAAAEPNGKSTPTEVRISDELRVTRIDWAREPNGKSEPAEAHLPEVAHETEEVPAEAAPTPDDVLTQEIRPEEIQR
jgi:cellulose synthase/poly-beta-1,6-N-acetylglucosamine synthase-like glycosyltransferase/peptidoglycan/xylan/chitin deacetylase (PgdA/CDA1 family)